MKPEIMKMDNSMTSQTADEAPRTFATPAIDVLDNDAELLVMADLPGVAKGGVTLSFVDDNLILHATHRGGRHVLRRTVPIAHEVRADAIEAELEHGVLTIHLPKAEQARSRQIPIR